MPTKDELLDKPADAAIWYEIPYASSEYTFPSEALIHRVRIDEHHIHLDLTDGRILSIPISWIPTVHNASTADRNTFQISRDRKVVIWDPDRCAINDELHVDDYLVSRRP
jgi:hypothetical protein